MAKQTRSRPRKKRGDTVLEREYAVYEAHRLEWVKEHEGEYILIKGDEVCGFFPTCDEALTAGFAKFGVVPIFVQEVALVEPVDVIPNVLI